MTSNVEQENSCTNAEVVNKYKAAGLVVKNTLRSVMEKAIDGANVFNLCKDAEEQLMTELAAVYDKEKIVKGVAFPPCISLNNCICHYSPLNDEGLTLKTGDLVKIELGAQIDEFPVLMAQSFIIGASASNPVKDIKADVILAAHYGAEAAMQLLRVGTTNHEVSTGIESVLKEFRTIAIEGTMSFQVSKNALGGEKRILLNSSESQRRAYEKSTIGEYEVYCVDIAVSSGAGKAKLGVSRPTIFKRTSSSYNLKMKTSRDTMRDIKEKFGNMAFNIRGLEGRAKLGLIECVNHQMLQPYDTLYDEKGAFVARCMFTVIMMPEGPVRVTDSLINLGAYESQYAVNSSSLMALLKPDGRNAKNIK